MVNYNLYGRKLSVAEPIKYKRRETSLGTLSIPDAQSGSKMVVEDLNDREKEAQEVLSSFLIELFLPENLTLHHQGQLVSQTCISPPQNAAADGSPATALPKGRGHRP